MKSIDIQNDEKNGGKQGKTGQNWIDQHPIDAPSQVLYNFLY